MAEAAAPIAAAAPAAAPKPAAPVSAGSTAPAKPAAPVAAPPPAPTEAPKPKPFGDWDGTKPLKVKLGDGSEVEFANLDALTRGVATHKWGNSANERAAKVERQMQALEAAAAKGDEELLRAIGIDPDAAFQKRLEREIERQKLSPEQLRAQEEQTRAGTLEQRAKAAEEKLARHLQEQQEARRWQEMEPKLKAAFESSDMVRDEASLAEIAEVGRDFAQAGIPLTPEQMVAEAADRQRERFRGRLAKLSADEIEKVLPDALVAELSKRRVLKWQAARNPGAAPPAAKTPAAPAPKDKGGYVSPEEARSRFGFKF